MKTKCTTAKTTAKTLIAAHRNAKKVAMAKQAKGHNTTNLRDLIVIAAAELRRLEERYNELDGMPKATGSEAIFRESEMVDALDRIYILADFISTTKATSLAACMVQLEQMFAIANLNFGSVNSDAETERDSRRFERLFFSILAFIKPMGAPAIVAAVAGDNAHLNPWRPYQERLAEVRRVA